MGKMDPMSSDSWTTVSTFNTPSHKQQSSHYIPARSASSSSESDKNKFKGLEVESVNSSSDQSWKKRIRWFRNTRSHRAAVAPIEMPGTAYVGGKMESAHKISAAKDVEAATTTTAAAMKPSKLTQQNSFQRIASWLTSNSSQNIEEDSVLDFQESEWTPQDSSYGAACPLFGWIPKKTRQHIEAVLLLLLVLCVVYLVVMIAIMITEARRDDSLTEDGGVLNLDDDRYIVYSDDRNKAASDDDDSYWYYSSGGKRRR